MTPAARHLRIYQGDNYSHRITFVDAVGAALPLTGTWRAQMRAYAASPTILVTFAVDTAQAAAGILTLTLPAATTATMAERGVWDLEQAAAGVVTTYLAGTVTVAGEVTR